MTDTRVFENWTGRRFSVEVGPVAHGGHCVTRVDGRVVFVRHAIPGERVMIEVTEDHGGAFCRADAVDILEASPDRVPALCAVAGPGGCGGCDWQHVSAAAQRRIKAAVVEEQLRRLAGLDVAVTVEELPGGQVGWRTRARMAVDNRGRAGFRAYRSHRVIPITDCPIAAPGMLDGVAERQWTPGTELELASDARGERQITEVPRRGRPRSIAGDGVVVQQAAGREWRLSVHGFWQVHPAAADVLAECVRAWSGASEGGTAWDLYGGAGLFASVLAAQVGELGSVLVVESGRGAVRDGIAALSDLPQVRFVAGLVDEVVDQIDERPEVIVLDPPRQGAGQSVVSKIAAVGPDRVVYVACDPAALARDIALFTARGYRMAQLRAFDAFPMTHHVECVALLIQDQGR